jgi:hypothetical protein
MQSSTSQSPSPTSTRSTGSYHTARILCNTNGVRINLADLYCEQQQLAIHSTPPRTRFIDPMSSISSINASIELPNEAPLQLPPRHKPSSAPIALSPQTIQTTLQTQPNLNATLLKGIANGLLQTIANWEADTAISTKLYEDQIRNLEQCILHYEDTFNEALTGYTLNNGRIANFHIPISGRLYQEAKWICLNDNETVSGFHSTQGPNKQPHIIDLYASPDLSVDSPLEPLLAWFCHILTSPGGDFQILQQMVADTDN